MGSIDDASAPVAGHYNQLDHFYLELWGEHIHHGLWTDPSFSPEEAVRHLVHEVARHADLKPGDRVCDVGCGYGAPARLWAREYGAEVLGFTVSNSQFVYAQQQFTDGPTPMYRLQDFLANDLPDGSMDAVVAIESLTHIADQPEVFQEASRLLRPGGRVVMCVWMAPQSVPAWAHHSLLEPICEEGHLTGLPTAGDLHRWAIEGGLEVDRLDDVTSLVRRTWSIVLGRFGRALVTDPAVLATIRDPSVPESTFALALLRVWVAQHMGFLRYGWLVATAD